MLTVAPFAGAWIEILVLGSLMCGMLVAPFAGAWIEMSMHSDMNGGLNRVAPFAGAWIEMSRCTAQALRGMSLPSRERGLQLFHSIPRRLCNRVAPFAGAWIEIVSSLMKPTMNLIVAPFAGAWIEILIVTSRPIVVS